MDVQFYLEWDFERVSEETEDWADRDIHTLLDEISSSPQYDKYIIIAKNNHDSLKGFLDASLI